MATSVLFDEPGPRARLRHRIYSVVFVAVVVVAAVLVVLKLNQAGEFQASIWQKLFATNVWDAIGTGLMHTLEAAAIAMVLSVVFGALFAVGRLSDHAFVRVPAIAVVEFFRAVPLLLLITVVFLGFGTSLGDAGSFIALVAGLTLYNGSVLAEVFRAGILAVPKGQSEAAYAIGMRKSSVMSVILVPQAVRYMMPAIVSQCVVALKDTSLGFTIGYAELLREGKSIAEYANSNLMTYSVIAIVYVAVNVVVAILAHWLERRMATRGRGAAAGVGATEAVLPPT